MMQAIQLSRAPIIASHSAVRSLCDVSRNLDDEQLKALAKHGGVIQVVAFRGYIKCDPKGDAARARALADLRAEFGIVPTTGRGGGRGAASAAADSQVAGLAEGRRREYDTKLQQIAQRYPQQPVANVKDLVDHIDYAVKLMGIDHVGISSDFDGGGGIDGYNSALDAINVTKELVRRGYTEEQIGKIWGGNLLRVLDDVQRVAKQIQAEDAGKPGR
jgi:membrane dipeptidase